MRFITPWAGRSVRIATIAVTVVILAQPGTGRAACPDFSSAPLLDSVTIPLSIAVGDYNRDGKADLAVTNGSSYLNRISIFMGNGNGTFATAVNYTVGTYPRHVAMGDFNADGKGDLAVVNYESHDVSILLGNSDGTFAAAVNYATGSVASYPRTVAIGDLNGDGKLDLAVSESNTSRVSIRLGNGNGTFQPANLYSPASTGFGILLFAAIGEFNGDGKPDLALSYYNGYLSIALGAGDGTFALLVSYTVGDRPVFIAQADLNGDGISDLAVPDSQSARVSVLRGNGNGTFGPPVHYSAAPLPSSVAAGDFNSDGKADLAVSADGRISLRLGNGDGSLQPDIDFPTVANPAFVAVGDFNGDGRPDLAAANYYQASSVQILLNTETCSANCGIVAPVNYSAGSAPSSVALGDINGDGKRDLVVGDSAGELVSVRLGIGNGTFGAAVNASVGWAPRSVAIGELNGDGKPDLAVAGFNNPNGSASILLGNGDGTFGAPVHYPLGANATSYCVAIGDFNGDGKADLAVGGEASNAMSILLGNGNGTFASPVTWFDLCPNSIAVGDFNRDGKRDLAVTNCSAHNTVSIWQGNGNGTFATPVRYDLGSPSGQDATSLAIADFNTDGLEDLAVANRFTNNVSILLGNANGTFQSALHYPARTSPMSVATGDFDRDGMLDLAVANSGSDNVSILAGDGNGAFTPVAEYGADGTYPVFVAIGDVNGDGKADLAVANRTSGNVSILLNTCVVVPPVPAAFQATAQSATNVSLTWIGSSDATQYEVARKITGGIMQTIVTVSSPSYSDTVSPSEAYLYQVRALGPGGTSAYSVPDVATTRLFSDDPISAGQTVIQRAHLIELRDAVNIVRALAGLSSQSWSDPDITAGLTPVRAEHIIQLRTALNGAFAVLGLPAPSFTTVVSTNGVVRAVDCQELRNALR